MTATTRPLSCPVCALSCGMSLTDTLLAAFSEQLAGLNREGVWTPAREALAVRLSSVVRYLTCRSEDMADGVR